MAARYATDLGLEAIRERSWGLADRLRGMLLGIEGVRPLDRGPTLCAIVTASVEGWRPPDLVRELRARGINTTGQGSTDAVIDYEEKGVNGSLRISPHYFNTEEELATLIAALEELTVESTYAIDFVDVVGGAIDYRREDVSLDSPWRE